MRPENDHETLETVRLLGLPVIIFGAGIVGEALYYACRKAGIRVECFCDNNINKTHSRKCDLEIVHTPDLKSRYADAIFLISAADIKDVIEQLRASGYSKWHASGLFLRDFDLAQCAFEAPAEFVEFAVSTCLLCHDGYLNPDRLFMRSVDIIITERCSLKCRDCSNLMQYYQDPKDCDIEEVMRTIDIFCSLADQVNEFRIIGGEPFMNRNIHLVMKRLINEPKVRKIVIYTNGTIVPKGEQLESLKHEKTLLMITDYGRLSGKLSDLTQSLDRNDIAYYVVKAQGWSACSGIGRHHRSVDEQKEVFRNCCAKNTLTLTKGKLFRCPFSANADSLRAVPDFRTDYVDFFRESPERMDIAGKKREIREFLMGKEFLETCDYCNGRPFGASEIQPAVQIGTPLEYERICLTKSELESDMSE
jgi:organic radical activating enzyme